MKILSNVFVCTSGNNLELADISFDDKIKSVRKITELTWDDISTNEKKQRFISEIESKKHLQRKDTIYGNYLLAMPGAIDPHVHFDTPGFEFREDIEHASIAAAFGGVTTIIDMPCTSIPPVTNLENFNTKLQAIRNRSLIDFAFWGGIGGNCFFDYKKNIFELREAGIAGFKVYTISGMKEFSDLTYDQIKSVAINLAEYGKPMAVHAEDKFIVTSIMNERIKLGKKSWQDYTESRSVEAEVFAVKKLIQIAEETKVKMLIVHLSSGESIKLIQQAISNGVDISAETCPHYLYFTSDDFNKTEIRNYLKSAPPVKDKSDKNQLWKALSENQMAFVSTDHAGCNPDNEKISENFWEVYGGIPGVEHRVPFLFSEGFLKKKITLEQTINLLSTNAAEYFNLGMKGKLSAGKDADITLIDLWNYQIVDSKKMHSKGKYTPFEKVKFNVVVDKTFLRGELIMDLKNNFVGKIGTGKYIKSEK